MCALVSVFHDIDPSEWIAANDTSFAIRDRFPVSQGHALVIPRREIASWWETTAEERLGLLDLVEVVKIRLDVEFGPHGYNVGFNDGVAAGQTVPHLHLHVIPRYVNDVQDPRGGVRHVIPGRGNYLLDRDEASVVVAPPQLVTPMDSRMRLRLVAALTDPRYDRIDLIVSFIMRSGVNLIAARLDEALARGAKVRLLTTDYMQITDPSALDFFLDRAGPAQSPSGSVGPEAEPGWLEVRVFSDASTSFHPKGYLFHSSTGSDGTAIVGSSNLSRSGLMGGRRVEHRDRTPRSTRRRVRARLERLPVGPTGTFLARRVPGRASRERPRQIGRSSSPATSWIAGWGGYRARTRGGRWGS